MIVANRPYLIYDGKVYRHAVMFSEPLTVKHRNEWLHDVETIVGTTTRLELPDPRSGLTRIIRVIGYMVQLRGRGQWQRYCYTVTGYEEEPHYRGVWIEEEPTKLTERDWKKLVEGDWSRKNGNNQ